MQLYLTPAVRENANQKIYGHLGHLKSIKQEHPDMKIRTVRMYDAGASRSGKDPQGL